MPASRFLLRTFRLVILLAPAWASAARAAWPHDPTLNLPVCTAANQQVDPAVIADGSGGMIVAWTDQRPGTTTNIFAQRISASGVPLWGNASTGLVVCNAANNQITPVLCSDGSGGAIIAWADARNPTGSIYAQRISGAGVAQWTANGVLVTSALSSAGGTNGEYNIAADAAGGAYIAWASSANEVRLQRLDATGAALFASGGIVLENTYTQQYYLSAVPDGSGGVIACWQGYLSGQADDILAQRVNAAGTALWAAGGRVVCGNTSDQQLPVVAADGQGGAIFAWTDYRGTNPNVYVQHVGANGAGLWIPNGSSIGNTANQEDVLSMVSDGAGGAIVSFDDMPSGVPYLYLQRLDYSGVGLWGTVGTLVVGSPMFWGSGSLTADGEGGAIVSWLDRRNGNADMFAQRLNANGYSQWTYDGVGVCTQSGSQWTSNYAAIIPQVASNGAGGAYVVWEDQRSDAGDIYAQNVERFGKLGDPGPVITKVSDVLADQGGEVSLQWTASWLDASPTFEVSDYSIWREAPAAAAQAAVHNGATLLAAGQSTPHATPGTRLFRALPAASGTAYWEYLVTVPARGLPGYSHVTPTTTDSTGASNPLTTFMVMAEDIGGSPFWASAPDSGYSVDNLPPGAPAPFTAAYASGATWLHWGANLEPDLAGYRLYRGSSSGFVPGPGNLVVAQADTGYADPGSAGSWYKLSAVDVHGNESAFTALGPGQTAGAPPAAPLAFALEPVRPNPVAARALVVRFVLSADSPARLELLDVGGRSVASRDVGALGAGAHALPLAEDVALAPGLYFVRLRQGTNVRTTRVSVVD